MLSRSSSQSFLEPQASSSSNPLLETHADSYAYSLVLVPELQWAWQKLPHVKERRTKDVLIGVIASALYYNSTLTISLLQQQNQLPAFLTTWGKVSPFSALTLLAVLPCVQQSG